MRKLFGLALLLVGVGAFLYYVQGWDWQRLKRTRAVQFVLREDASATDTPIGARGIGTHWEEAAPMSEPRMDFGAALIGDTIYVVGGVDTYTRSLNSVEAYDIAADAWREVAKLPQPIHHPAVATDGAKLYVIGGFTGLAARPLDSMYVYDPKADVWKELSRLEDFRGGAAAVYLKDRIYLAGGQTTAGLDGLLQSYDLVKDDWSDLEKSTMPRAQLRAVAEDGKIYTMGGSRGSATKYLATTEVYDPATSAWKTLPDMSVPRNDFAAASVGGLIYVFGGESDADTVGAIETFDPKKGTWSTLSLKFDMPRHGLEAVAWKDRVYLLGGGRRAGFSVTDLNSVLILDQAPAKK